VVLGLACSSEPAGGPSQAPEAPAMEAPDAEDRAPEAPAMEAPDSDERADDDRILPIDARYPDDDPTVISLEVDTAAIREIHYSSWLEPRGGRVEERSPAIRQFGEPGGFETIAATPSMVTRALDSGVYAVGVSGTALPREPEKAAMTFGAHGYFEVAGTTFRRITGEAYSAE
jgi:hypothetical protein